MSKKPSFRDIEKLSAYLDGELNAPTAKRLENRLARDPNLRAALDDLRATRAVLRRAPQRRAPRNFTLSPQMVAKRPPLPRLASALNYASLAAALLFFFTFASGLGFGAQMNAPESSPAEAAPTGFNIGGMSAEDMAEMPAAAEEAPAPAPPMDAPAEEEPPAEAAAPAAAPENTTGGQAMPTPTAMASPAATASLEAAKTLTETATVTPTQLPPPAPTPLPAQRAPVAPLTPLQRGLLIASILFLLVGWILRRKTIAKWQKASK